MIKMKVKESMALMALTNVVKSMTLNDLQKVLRTESVKS